MKKVFLYIAILMGMLAQTGYCIDNEPDGMPDDWETTYGLNTSIDDSLFDLDNDGLTNIMEYQKNTYPNDSDSDNDGLLDGQEVAHAISFAVNSYTANTQDTPAVASSSDRYLICWSSTNQDGDGLGIYGQFFAEDSEKIGSEFKANTTTTGNQYYPMAEQAGDSYLIAWAGKSQTIKSDGKYGQILDNNGMVTGSEFFIDSYITKLDKPLLANNGSEYAVIGCSHHGDSTWDIISANIFASDGTSIASSIQVNSTTSGNHWYPHIASNGSGYMVVWFTDAGQDGSSHGIFGQLLDGSGNKIGSQIQINSYTTDSQWYPNIASNGTNYMVAWDSVGQDGSLRGIYGQIISATGAKIGNEIPINTTTQYDQYQPSIAATDSTYLVVWTNNLYDPTKGSDVYAQCISSTGEKRGKEFIVNSIISANQELRHVIAGKNYFLVIWDSLDLSSNETQGLFGSFFDSYGNRIGETFQLSSQPVGNIDVAVIGDQFCVAYPKVNENKDIEATITNVTFSTNPLAADSDSDFMPDGWEIENILNPLLNDADDDPDNDGLNNLEEHSNNTDPHNPDTDNDGMLDGDEITAETDPNNPQSRFAITNISSLPAGNIAVTWSGSDNPSTPYKIRWFQSLDSQGDSIDPDNDSFSMTGDIRTWVDEGDNDATPPREAPSSSSMRFYQVYIQ